MTAKINCSPICALIDRSHAIDRQYLADYLEGKLKRKKGRPRGGRAALNVRNVAVLVDYCKQSCASRKALSSSQMAVDLPSNFMWLTVIQAPARETLENYLRRSSTAKNSTILCCDCAPCPS